MMHDFNFSFSEKGSVCLFSASLELYFPVNNTEGFLGINFYQLCAFIDFSSPEDLLTAVYMSCLTFLVGFSSGR